LQVQSVAKIKTHFMFSNFSKNCASYGAMWKSTVQPKKPPMTIKYGACAVRATQLRVQTH